MISRYLLFLLFVSTGTFAQNVRGTADGTITKKQIGYVPDNPIVKYFPELKAFTSAVGKGKYAGVGQPTRSVYKVTKLTDDSSPGTFRDAISQSNRDIVFTVGGTILLDSHINTSANNLRIHFQTAPGDGIAIGVSSPDLGISRALLGFSGDDIMMRHFRLRRLGDDPGSNAAGLFFLGGSRIIVDHMTLSWCTDDMFGAMDGGGSNLTLQNSFIYETATKDGNAPTGAKGMLFYNDLENLTLYGNVLAHMGERNPAIKTHNADMEVDMINNLIYNRGGYGATFSIADDNGTLGGLGSLNVNFIGNKYIAGNQTFTSRQDVGVRLGTDQEKVKLYVENNLGQNRTLSDPEWDIIGEGGIAANTPAPTSFQSLARFDHGFDYDIIVPVTEVESKFLPTAGAYIHRDSDDIRVANEITTRTGNLRLDTAVYTYPTLSSGTAPTDSNNNGIADTFETEHNLTGDGTQIKSSWVFDGVTWINNTGWNNRDVYFSWLTGYFDNDNPIGSSSIELNTLKAFPSAQGRGVENITGGKGGKIFYVTTTANNETGTYNAGTGTHSGSLRYAMEHSDAGYIIFRVGGVFNVSGDTDLAFTSGDHNKTIMGGTAPYPGVIFYGGQFSTYNDNTIIRGITSLVGTGGTAGVSDAFVTRDSDGIIISDNTFGWAGDESFSADDQTFFIAQRNLGLESDPGHNRGSILATDTQVAHATGAITAHDNAYIHNGARFPNIRALDNDYVDDINNFAYNWAGRLFAHKFQIQLNHINNYYKRGPRTSATPFFKWSADDESSPVWTDNVSIYTKGNIIPTVLDDPNEDNTVNWNHHITANGYTKDTALPSGFFIGTPHNLGTDINIKTALESYQYNIVGKNVGARYYMDSNGVRQKYIHPFVDDYFDDAIDGTDDAYINNLAAFTLPSIPSSGTAYTDSDNDGMADAWETAHGLNVGVDDKESVKLNWTIDGANFTNTAGFTNMQMFDDYVHGGFVILKDQN